MKGRFYPCAGRIYGTGCNFGNRIIGTDAAYLEAALADSMRIHTEMPGGSAETGVYRIAQRTGAPAAAAVKKYFFRQATQLR